LAAQLAFKIHEVALDMAHRRAPHNTEVVAALVFVFKAHRIQDVAKNRSTLCDLTLRCANIIVETVKAHCFSYLESAIKFLQEAGGAIADTRELTAALLEELLAAHKVAGVIPAADPRLDGALGRLDVFHAIQ